MAYTLTLTAADGTTTTGTLDIQIAASAKSPVTDLATPAEDDSQTTVSVTPITGTITINGVGTAQLQGVNYCTLLGPPITNILTGTINGENVGVHCNVIDSPGVYIGGSVLIGQSPFGLFGQR